MTAAVLSAPWPELIHDAAARTTISSEGKRSSRDLRFSLDQDVAPSISVDEVYRESLASLVRAYREASRPDWDGHGAEPVDALTVAQALSFLRLIPSTVVPPEISAHPDGELAFEWAPAPRGLLTVSVNRSGKLSYAALVGETRQHGTEFILDALPESITLALRKVHSTATA